MTPEELSRLISKALIKNPTKEIKLCQKHLSLARDSHYRFVFENKKIKELVIYGISNLIIIKPTDKIEDDFLYQSFPELLAGE